LKVKFQKFEKRHLPTKTAITMEQFNTLRHDFDFGNDNLNNIVRINTAAEEEDTEDYDFDYDPNQMYYDLNRSF